MKTKIRETILALLGTILYLLVLLPFFLIWIPHLILASPKTILTDKFGFAYKQYKKHVPRWIPRLQPYGANDSESQSNGV